MIFIIGDKYNDWIVIGEAKDRIDSSGKHHKRLLCQCKCGKIQTKDVYKLKNGAKMCRDCYLKMVPNNGVPFERKYNKYEFQGDIVIGYINNSDKTFIIDVDDYGKIKEYCWHETQDRIFTTINKKKCSLHRFILGLTSEEAVVDHINRNPLDNRKQNLRICSLADNAKNRSLSTNNKSGHNGVHFDKKSKKWIAYVCCNKKRYNCGRFDNYEEALKARIKKEKELFGEFAPM